MARSNANREAAIAAGYTPGTRDYRSFMRYLQLGTTTTGKQQRTLSDAKLVKLPAAVANRYEAAGKNAREIRQATKERAATLASARPARAQAAGVRVTPPRAIKVTGQFQITGDKRSDRTRTVRFEIGRSEKLFSVWEKEPQKFMAQQMGLDYSGIGSSAAPGAGGDQTSDGELEGVEIEDVEYID